MVTQHGWSWTDSRRNTEDLLGALGSNWDIEELLWERKMWNERINSCATLAEMQVHLLENPPSDLGAAWTCAVAVLTGALEAALRHTLAQQARADEAEGEAGRALLLDKACELSWAGCAGVRTLLGKHPGEEAERIKLTAGIAGDENPLAVSWASGMVSVIDDIATFGGMWDDDTNLLAGVAWQET